MDAHRVSLATVYVLDHQMMMVMVMMVMMMMVVVFVSIVV